MGLLFLSHNSFTRISRQHSPDSFDKESKYRLNFFEPCNSITTDWPSKRLPTQKKGPLMILTRLDSEKRQKAKKQGRLY